MIISSSILNKALQAIPKKAHIIKNDGNAVMDSTKHFKIFFLIIAIIFVIMELLVLFYAVNMAIKCTKAGHERTVHFVLATVFTFPYALISMFFSPLCQKRTY